MASARQSHSVRFARHHVAAEIWSRCHHANGARPLRGDRLAVAARDDDAVVGPPPPRQPGPTGSPADRAASSHPSRCRSTVPVRRSGRVQPHSQPSGGRRGVPAWPRPFVEREPDPSTAWPGRCQHRRAPQLRRASPASMTCPFQPIEPGLLPMCGPYRHPMPGLAADPDGVAARGGVVGTVGTGSQPDVFTPAARGGLVGVAIAMWPSTETVDGTVARRRQERWPLPARRKPPQDVWVPTPDERRRWLR